MSLKKVIKDENGGRAKYISHGDFEQLIFFCPDIRYDYLKKGTKDEFISKTPEELENELKHYLISLSIASYKWYKNNIIKDYWLVVTPEICDRLPKHDAPLKNNNYIVTPFYTDDIQLVTNIYKESNSGFGTQELNPDRRRRKGSNAIIGFYLVCELNEESSFFDDAHTLDKQSSEYLKKIDQLLLTLSLKIGSDLTDFMSLPIRSFIQYGENAEGIQFVEQYFDSKVSKKIKGYSLGEGYLRNLMAKVNLDKNTKYIAFEDLFASTGSDFCMYALPKEELKELSKIFEDNSWLPRPEFDSEDEQAKRILAKDFISEVFATKKEMMYYTILVNTESFEYEHNGEEIGEKEIQFNANLFWHLANRVLYSFAVNGRTMKNAYIGLGPDYEKIYRIESPNLDDDSNPDTFSKDEMRIKDFLEIAGDSLKQWPDNVDHISVTIEFCDVHGMPTDAHMLRFSEVADIDCEAVIFDEDTKQLVCQGYERGEYETGYYSNAQEEIYLASHKYQKTLKDLQDVEILKMRMIT